MSISKSNSETFGNQPLRGLQSLRNGDGERVTSNTPANQKQGTCDSYTGKTRAKVFTGKARAKLRKGLTLIF